jgi:GR25 family glycosyltransferase involved in LPS biosynthesis
LPHPDRKRFENSENYSPERENEIKNYIRSEFTEDELNWQVDYVLINEMTEKNKQKLFEQNKIYSNDQNYYIKPETNWNIQQIDGNYYVATEMNKNQSILNGFPSVYYISLEESSDRRQILEYQFLSYDIKLNAIISKRHEQSDDIIKGDYIHTLNNGTKGCCVSHLKAIKRWYEETDDDYGFFCEDDLSLETVDYWDFTWEEFIESIPDDAECVQLLTIRDNYETYELRERLWNDWGATAYILTRAYAKKIIDTFIEEDAFNLNLPNQNVMPLIENILFSSVGKCYTIPLFVENINFQSTFVDKDEDVVDGHKTNHKKAANVVLNYWKNKNNEDVITLDTLLSDYSIDTENPNHNFNLGLWYENQGHTAPALSYYLRCAERAYESDSDLAYEALIRGSFCYEKQGTRDGSSRSLLFQAQAYRTDRPEAYFLLSSFAQKREWWQDCYINADLALKYCNFDCLPLRTSVKYPGKYGLLFQKAIGGWWWGKSDQSRSLLMEIINDYDLEDDEYQVMCDTLKKMGIEISEERNGQ